DLFPSYFVERHQHKGKTVIHKPYEKNSSHCYYHGKIENSHASWAAVSTCNGLSGIIFDGVEMHFIERIANSTDNLHYVYRESDMKPRNFSCGFKGSSTLTDTFTTRQRRFRRNLGIRGPYNSNKGSRYVELVLVNDYKEFKEMKENKDAVIARNKDIANLVNALYSPLNIFIALVGIEVWSEFDQITLAKDGDTTLTNFLHYRRERLVSEIPNDNAQLITGITFEGGVVGKALKGPICTYEYSGGVNMDHSPNVALVATTVAHELGHNFGMEHDNDECSCPDERCIMAPSSSSNSPTHWSECSIKYLHTAFDHGMDYCLRNQPSRILGPVCGNGFVEHGEECDCGLPLFCHNPCCNASSCTLFANATCATGECCEISTCQFKTAATLCRHSSGECDLPEYCDGKNEFCPNDVFKQDGSSCSNERAYCYRGDCRSHSDQCKLLWGPTGQMSDSRCFDQNKRGSASGNCGYLRLNQTYKPCDRDDILCGMLHCTHLNERLEFGMESVAIQSRSFITTGGKILACRSAIVDLGLNSIDPGLAPDGARCGINKVCVSQRCMPVDSLRTAKCPYDCNGNGVCNSRGNCHCKVGYAPPFCDVEGSGGSEDSGPAADPHEQNYLATVLYIFFLGVVPVVSAAVCAGYYYRQIFQKWWIQKTREQAIKSRAKEAAHRKKSRKEKFTVDRNSLRSVDISTPMQPDLLPANALVKSHNSIPTSPVTTLPRQPSNQGTLVHKHSVKAAKLNLDRNSLRNLEISQPILQQDLTNSNRIVPIRPAPPLPNGKCGSDYGPSWSPDTSRNPVSRSSSIQSGASSTQSSTRRKRLSGPSLRPANPPPRPPPPKTPSTSIIYEQPIYNEIYDDCQNHSNGRNNNQEEAKSQIYATINNPTSKNQSFPRHAIKDRPLPNVPTALKSTPSVVAALARRFETPSAETKSTKPPLMQKPQLSGAPKAEITEYYKGPALK
uniref:Peptidase M12B domain-containing protein n=1 Tax=Strigamia maritima TaxID=126957 RepID=T1JKJ7_STRMM